MVIRSLVVSEGSVTLVSLLNAMNIDAAYTGKSSNNFYSSAQAMYWCIQFRTVAGSWNLSAADELREILFGLVHVLLTFTDDSIKFKIEDSVKFKAH